MAADFPPPTESLTRIDEATEEKYKTREKEKENLLAAKTSFLKCAGVQ
jgi:hypothetical protein